MKSYITLALLGVIGSTVTLFAIPDVVGNFLIGTSSRVEDFALSRDTWSEKIFSADWEAKSVESAEEEVYQLKRSFVVFGVEAERVNAFRRNDSLERFVITYRAADEHQVSANAIIKKLQRNIEAFTGEKLMDSAAAGGTVAGYRCHYKDFEISLEKNQADRVLVTIRRAGA